MKICTLLLGQEQLRMKTGECSGHIMREYDPEKQPGGNYIHQPYAELAIGRRFNASDQ